MSEFFLDSEVVRVGFPDEQWIDIKEELTQADQDAVTNAMVKMHGSEMEMTIGRTILLQRMVVAWSFPEPVNAENLSRLRRKYREPTLVKIDELNSQAYNYIAKN